VIGPRWARLGMMAAAALVLLLIAAAFALPLLLDVNRYRPAIASALQDATGRAVTLGPIHFALLPAPSLAVDSLAVADSPRYPGREALRARSLSIRLGLLDLLRGRITLETIILNRPSVTLIRDGRGRWNFDDLLERASAARAAPAGRSVAAGPSGASVMVARAVVRTGTVTIYDDAVVPGKRSRAVIGPLDVTVAGGGDGGETRIDLSIGLGGSRLAAEGRLTARDGGATLEAQARASSFRAADLVPLLPWLGVAQARGLDVGGTLDLEGSATLPLERLEAIRFKGSLKLRDVSYRDASMRQPLKGLSGLVKVDGDHASWNDFTARLGTSSLSGGLQVENFLQPRIGIALTSPKLDFNEILAAFLPEVPGNAPAASAAKPEALPVGLLGQVSARGTLSVGAARFQTFDLSQVRATLSFERSVLALKEMQAVFYGGTLTGTASADVAAARPRVTLGVRVEGLDVNPLITAYDPALKDLLGGKLTGRIDLQAAGQEMKALMAGARGTAALEIVQGRITSFSVLKQLAALLELAGGKGIGRDETPFEYLRGHLDLADGKARTEDLALHATDLDLEGKGWIGLEGQLDLMVAARFSEESTRGMLAKNARLESFAGKDGRLTVHMNLSGNLASPKFGLDTRAQAGEAKEKVKERVRDRLLDRLRKGLGQGGQEEQGGESKP